MIPVQLTFQGLYSYAKSVTIDFKPLVAARLFGIFGSVGSGKSSILEAIMFVLFDRTTRLNKAGDDRYYNMMNLQSKEMSIDFIFMSGPNNTRKYRFYFLARRSAKDFNKVEVKDRSYYQWSKNDWKPLKNPEVLGMTYENFMQTVIIPQGRFRQFIDQKATARTEMMKELFNLDRFDIASKAFKLLSSVKGEHQYLSGQLSQFDEINSGLIKQLKKEIEQLKERNENNNEQVKKLTEENQKLQLLQHLHQELMQVKDSLQVLDKEEVFFQQKLNQLERYLRVRELFKEKILRQQESLKNAIAKKQEFDSLINQLKQWEKENEKLKNNWQEAQKAYKQKDHLQAQIADLSLLIQLKEASQNAKSVNDQLSQLERKLKVLETNLEGLNQQIEQGRLSVDKKYVIRSKLHELNSLLENLTVLNETQRRNTSVKNEIQQLEKEIENLDRNKADLAGKQTDQKQLKNEIDKAREHLHSLLVENDWRQHAGELEDGKPCPLCGATNHPDPFTHEDQENIIEEHRTKLKRLESDYHKQLEVEHQLELVTVKIADKKTQLDNTEGNLENISLEINRLTKNVQDNNLTTKKLSLEIERLKKELNTEEKKADGLTIWNEQHKKLSADRANWLVQKQELIANMEHLQGSINQITKGIQTLDHEVFLGKTSTQLSQLEKQLVEKLKRIDRTYQVTYDQLAISEQQLNHGKGQLNSLEQQVVEIESGLKRLEEELVNICKKHGFKGVREVQKVLELDLNPARERKEIEAYQREVHGLKTRVKTLSKKMGKQRYLEQEHLKVNTELDQLKAVGEQIQTQLTSKTLTHNQYLIQLEKKDTLEKDLKKLTVRKDNVQEICNLLRGNGFINFISSVYLQNLIESANIRFRKLTSNQLSLELSLQNEFMVRDHLNGGKLRLLKTLSGGQIFQASLSLALGLAENVKNLNEADQSFFFLDEGFGSLDRASLQLVFETLKSLQKENRIVGVISHVEELQSEIDTYLKVDHHPQKGSIIHNSWEIDSKKS